jgi:hypothetical protein
MEQFVLGIFQEQLAKVSHIFRIILRKTSEKETNA